MSAREKRTSMREIAEGIIAVGGKMRTADQVD
jgi:hypothetical protein